MRTVTIACLVLATAGAARAQPPAAPEGQERTAGTLDAGVRLTGISGDPARLQRYQDLRSGLLLHLFRYDRSTERWLVSFGSSDAGYRDQRYFARAERPGRLRAVFTYDALPVFLGAETTTPYVPEAAGVLRLGEGIQQGIQAGTLTLAALNPLARPFETRSPFARVGASLTYTASPDVDVRVALSSTSRSGEVPWGAPFGLNLTTEVARPVDTRTTDLSAGVEWSRGRATVRAAYDASWFDNEIPVLIWDNPLRATDTTNPQAQVTGIGASQGRMALPPDSSSHTVSAAGTVPLPGRGRLTAHLSIGTWRQDEPLLPHTINTAIPAPELARPTADASIRRTGALIRFTSRPARSVSLNARYRGYDFDTRTPHFPVTDWVRVDGVLAGPLGTGGTEPRSHTRHDVAVDAGLTRWRFGSISAGYSLESIQRTFRIFEATREHVGRVALDSLALPWLTVRASLERSRRAGRGFDLHELEVVGEQPAMRHFDVADRRRTRVLGSAQVTPHEVLVLTATVAVGRDDYHNSGFGLRDSDHHTWSVGVDAFPAPRVTAGVAYGAERYDTLQRSRQADPGPQFVDPTRDWEMDAGDRVHYVAAHLTVPGVFRRTNVRFTYDYNRTEATYLYRLPPGSTLAPRSQLPPVLNAWHHLRADGEYGLTGRVAIGLTYLLERYQVDDYAFSPDVLAAPALPGGVFLRYFYRPYTGNSAWARLIYRW